MKIKKPNAELVCKQFEDVLAPRLRLSLTDRAVYYHLLRHSHLEGKSRIHFANAALARDLGISKIRCGPRCTGSSGTAPCVW